MLNFEGFDPLQMICILSVCLVCVLKRNNESGWTQQDEVKTRGTIEVSLHSPTAELCSDYIKYVN